MFKGLTLGRVVLVPKRADWDPWPASIELYDDGVGLAWLSPEATPAKFPPRTIGSLFDIEDDVGTSYKLDAAGAAGVNGTLHGRNYFTPAVPPEATVFTIQGSLGAIDVELH